MKSENFFTEFMSEERKVVNLNNEGLVKGLDFGKKKFTEQLKPVTMYLNTRGPK